MLKRRRKTNASGNQLGSDSFIDVLSNTVGALALLCIMASLNASDLHWKLFISREHVSNSPAAKYTVHAGRIKFLDEKACLTELNRLHEAGQLAVGPNPQPPSALVPFRVDFNMQVIGDQARGQVRIEDSTDANGDLVTELLAGRGQVAEQMRGLDPKSIHVELYIDPDSFEHYLPLRAYCQRMGLEIGWSPWVGAISIDVSRGPAEGSGGFGVTMPVE